MLKSKNTIAGLTLFILIFTSITLSFVSSQVLTIAQTAVTKSIDNSDYNYKESILVKFKDGLNQQKSTNDIGSKLFGVASVSGDQDFLKSNNLAVIKPKNGQNPDQILKDLKANSTVQVAQYNYPYQTLAYTPNDPNFASGQWNLQDSNSGIYMPSAWQTAGRKITNNSSLVCSEATPSCGGVNTVKVAVIDSGVNVGVGNGFNSLPGSSIDTVDSTRFYIAGGCQIGEINLGDFPANSGNYYCRTNGNQFDDTGHGTRTASIVAMADDSSDGIGIGYNTQILPIAISSNSLNTLNVMFALEHAMNRGAKVVNLSLGTPFNDPILESWINTIQPI